MGVIKITNMYDEQRTAKNTGKPYMVRVVEGLKVGSDKEWVQPVFMNNKQLIKKLDQFARGEMANFVYEKQTRGDYEFFDLVDIREPDEDYVKELEKSGGETAPKAKGGGQKKSSNESKGGSKSTLTKEEWAEKDRVKSMSIAKGVAIKIAAEILPAKTKPSGLIDYAEELLPWLLDTEPLADASPWNDDEDPLDPPVDDDDTPY